MSERIRISTQPGQLNEGLFGQIFLHIFEILPYLDNKGIRPDWSIRSDLYGSPDDYLVIPGLLETNDEVNSQDAREVNLRDLRYWHAVALGGDWDYTSQLWKKYFRWPERVVQQANEYPVLEGALGVHYRGTDKNDSLVETNPVSPEDFLMLVQDFLAAHSDIQMMYVATDDPTFAKQLITLHPSLRIVQSGAARHHKDGSVEKDFSKGDHALLDCLLLSRCKYLVKCQSALSGFAKILNPRLEAYRVSANKPPWWSWGIPYFPDAYLPKLESKNLQCQKLLEKLMAGDWTEDKKAFKKFGHPFKYQTRKRYTVSMPPRFTIEGLRARIEWRLDSLMQKVGR